MYIYNEENLMIKAKLIIGYNIMEIAKSLNYCLPKLMKYNTGCIGKLIEYYFFDTHINNQFNQDIPYLGIEIKTVTINPNKQVLYDSYICSCTLLTQNVIWEKNNISQKISKILWMPIITYNSKTPILNRIIGTPVLWQPTLYEKTILKYDWTNIIHLLIMGYTQDLNEYNGYILKIKNKSKKNIKTKIIDQNGNIIFTVPKAFYFKRHFITSII
ncbi:MutH/Sau3AI family endonuclease [Enterobacteriaceae endosymbiont of Macroplea appendiculata]|uniref:MutH/Sau3AI family endonuclease n=1 Tax=Enterobacteriaceae endosymbiont of Macroplea appendiculata TaxID=2675790 RepID=UPI00144A1242|nr:MutH/Sau3AI family endonuclease [Enterobacteriaceae endosymbiont of Macroplea appendiculata]QJC30999.1 hypothetical protein GJT86_02080 [Enterobacteriaceae endosymbiont of Macroplea appendiculata]